MPPCLTLLHFSDIHGQQSGLARICDLLESLGDLCDDSICTGDLQRKNHAAGLEYWHETPGSKRILTCIGNHDVLNNDVYDWTDLIPSAQQAEEFIAPFVPYWGETVTWAPGQTYYSKFYPEQKIRLIVLNSMLGGEDAELQTVFLRKELGKCLTQEQTAVLAIHDPPKEPVLTESRFTALQRRVAGACGPGCLREYQQAVEDFTEQGGDFACWLCGHTHVDFICHDRSFPRQLFVVVGGADVKKGLRHGDSPRVIGGKSEDLFNMITFDRSSKVLKIIRVGADRDFLLRRRKCLTYQWNTQEILYEE